MKKLFSKKNILIVLIVILIISAIVGTSVYARYSQTVSAGTLSIEIEPSSTSTTVGTQTYDDTKMPFDKIHPVYPFG